MIGLTARQYWARAPLDPDSNAHRYLALGDSYTVGDGVGYEDRWPVQLVHRLRREGVPLVEPEFVAESALTAAELAGRLADRDLRGSFALVSLLVGVNNQYRRLSPEAYRIEFRGVARAALALAGRHPERLVVLSIPDWGVTPFGVTSGRADVSKEIDAFNHVNRGEALAIGAHYVDVTPVSRSSVGEPGALAPDGLHPSRRMYAVWVDLIMAHVWPG